MHFSSGIKRNYNITILNHFGTPNICFYSIDTILKNSRKENCVKDNGYIIYIK